MQLCRTFSIDRELWFAQIAQNRAFACLIEKLTPRRSRIKLNNEKVEGREDLAYVLGTCTMTITPPGALGPVKDSGKFVTVVRRQRDGSWLCAVDMFSSDLPPPQ
jgi:ketosteroid isomerase-like protein